MNFTMSEENYDFLKGYLKSDLEIWKIGEPYVMPKTAKKYENLKSAIKEFSQE